MIWNKRENELTITRNKKIKRVFDEKTSIIP